MVCVYIYTCVYSGYIIYKYLQKQVDQESQDEAQLHFAPHGVRHLRHFRQDIVDKTIGNI